MELVNATVMALKILSWLLYFWKICAPLSYLMFRHAIKVILQ